MIWPSGCTSLRAQTCLLILLHHESSGLWTPEGLLTGCTCALRVAHSGGRGRARLEHFEAGVAIISHCLLTTLRLNIPEAFPGNVSGLRLLLSKHAIGLLLLVTQLLQLLFQLRVLLSNRPMLFLEVDNLLDQQVRIFLLTRELNL